LQILLAEIRASFESTALSVGADANTSMDSPLQAAREIVNTFLLSIPAEDSVAAPAWTAVVSQAEAELQAGLDRAITAISAWRDVPVRVVDAAKETQQWVSGALADDGQHPAWLRPEWAGLAPGLERFWRRRRLARRRLIDPDYPKRSFEDSDEK
jgi:hypothetical protein